MNKKLCIIMITILVIGLVGACGKSSADAESKNEVSKPSKNQFDATILKIEDDYIIVEALEGQDIVGEVRVQTGLLSKDEIPELVKGDTVRITHDGKMTMSIPPQMFAVELNYLGNL